MASSLSIVPPVCPRPRAHFYDLAAARCNKGNKDKAGSIPTPPVECLSTVIPSILGTSTSPVFAISSDSIAVSRAVIPFSLLP